MSAAIYKAVQKGQIDFKKRKQKGKRGPSEKDEVERKPTSKDVMALFLSSTEPSQ